MKISSVISIIILFAFGIGMILIGVLNQGDMVGVIITIVFGLISIGLGLYMIFNANKEDSIEQIKKTKTNKKFK